MSVLLHVSILLPFIPLIVYLTRNRYSNKPALLLCLLLVTSVVFDLINAYLLPYLEIQSWAGYHLFTAIEFTLYLLYFRQILFGSLLRQFLFWLIPIFWGYKLIDAFYLSGLTNFDTGAVTVEAVVVISLCICFYHQTLQQLQVQSLERFPPFWICSGILLYFSGNLFLFLFSSYILDQGYTYFVAHWYLHAFFSLLKYVAFSIGLWWNNPTLKTSPSLLSPQQG